jgi:hypothetical protein
VVYRNFALEQAGHFLKARAIDIYGNYSETGPIAIDRRADNSLPSATYNLNGTVIGDSPVGGHPFAVNIDLDDVGSGVD